MGEVTVPKERNFVGEGNAGSLAGWLGRREPPDDFIVARGGRLGPLLDVSRSVARRARRRLILAGYAEARPDALRAVNRLPDVPLVLARDADGRHDLSRG